MYICIYTCTRPPRSPQASRTAPDVTVAYTRAMSHDDDRQYTMLQKIQDICNNCVQIALYT